MRVFFGALISVAIFTLSAGGARAAGYATCVAYVEEAMKEVAEAKEMGCDFDFAHDPMWSSDPMVHTRWCHDASEDSVEDQTVHNNTWGLQYPPRYNLVLACHICTNYTARTMKQIAEAKRMHCTFPPGESARWDPDHKDHYHWCMGLTGMTDGDSIEVKGNGEELDARDGELKQCRDKVFGRKLGNQSNLRVPGKKIGTAKTRKIGHAKDPTYNIGSEGSGNSGSGGSTPPPCGGVANPCPGKGGSGGDGSSSGKVLGPGLLESDNGLSRNSPSARGAPSSPSGGSLRGSTFSH